MRTILQAQISQVMNHATRIKLLSQGVTVGLLTTSMPL